MTKKLGNTVLFVFTFCTLNSTAWAQDDRTPSSVMPEPRQLTSFEEWRPHMGLTVGVATPEGRYDSAAELGVDVGAQPYIPFGVGAEFLTTATQESENDNLRRTTILLRGTYNFGGTLPMIRYGYVGVGVGPAFHLGGNTELAAAPMVGFDIPLQHAANHEYLSLGARAKYMFVAGGEADAFAVNGALKYWY